MFVDVVYERPLQNQAVSHFFSCRYPDMSVEEIAESCPFCRNNCNCNVCLCSRGIIKVQLTLMSCRRYP